MFRTTRTGRCTGITFLARCKGGDFDGVGVAVAETDGEKLPVLETLGVPVLLRDGVDVADDVAVREKLPVPETLGVLVILGDCVRVGVAVADEV